MDQVVRISSMVLPARRDCVGGADVLVAAAAGAPVAVVEAPGAAVEAAPNRPPVVDEAAGAPVLAGGCDELVPAAPNKDGADGVVVAAVPACEVPELAAPPPRLEKRLAVVAVVLGAADVFCCPLKMLEL